MILVDTTPLVALCDPRDAKHRVAVGHLQALAGGEFVVCEPVVAEACFLLPHHSQRLRLRALLDALRAEAIGSSSDPSLWSQVFDWLARYREHEPDWADGCLAVLSGADRHVRVWTYDREFRTTWRRPDGTAIPMAVRWT